jgi:hypothetical protein
MRAIRHPLSGAVYDLTDRGTIRVERDSRTGEFDSNGVWLSGELRSADPQLCLWIGGVELPNRFQQAARALSEQETA